MRAFDDVFVGTLYNCQHSNIAEAVLTSALHHVTAHSLSSPSSAISPAPAQALAAERSSTRPTCDNCGKVGHLRPNCWSRGGGKEGQRPSWARRSPGGGGGGRSGGGGSSGSGGNSLGSHSSGGTAMLAFGPGIAFMASLMVGERATSVALAASASPSPPSAPILTYSDSGVSHHYFRDRRDFVTYRPLSLSATGAGHSFPVVGQGLIVKVAHIDGRRVICTFIAFHALTMHQNLVSTLQFDREGCDIRTRDGVNTIWSPSGYVILQSQSLEGVSMYIFDLLPLASQEIVSERLKLAPSEQQM